MAGIQYDETGNMTAYFIITFLSLILVPLTISSIPNTGSTKTSGCQCSACLQQRERVAQLEKGSWLKPKFSRRTLFLSTGWALLGYLSYRVAGAKSENTVYNPFEILDIDSSATLKEIKSHYKQLSKLFHPDKVKVTEENTLEMISNKFVDLTKAYKSLTDETIRQNLKEFGNPDGRQEVSTGISLPTWLVDKANNIYVLGVYGLVFGIGLPMLVSKWWSNWRSNTKEGVNVRTAAAFFKSIQEESGMDEVVGALGKAYEWERPVKTASNELVELEKEIAAKLGGQSEEKGASRGKWEDIKRLSAARGLEHQSRKKALVLLYAHLLRIDVKSQILQKEQARVILQTPALLNALLTITTARNWLQPTLAIMRLHAYISQALPPASNTIAPVSSTASEPAKWAQLPGIAVDESPKANSVEELVSSFENQGDDRAKEIKKAAQHWGKLDLVDVGFKVIGERLVTPAAIVFLVVKLRISRPTFTKSEPKDEKDVDATKRFFKSEEEKDTAFLTSKDESEDLGDKTPVLAHAPYWPGSRKPSWWLVLADDKSNRVVVPPMKISDVPYANDAEDRDYRSYKIQFQAPQTVGTFTWKIYLVSDTFVGEEISRDLALKIDDHSALTADEQGAEDEISDPDEDTLAGQMAVMRGGTAKKSTLEDEESDEDSSTDDDKESDDSSDSDSD